MTKAKKEYKLSRGVNVADGIHLTLSFQGINKRTKLWTSIESTRRELREYVGVSTPASELLIQRIVYKHLRLSYYEAHSLAEGTQGDDGHYLNMANSLRLDLQTLKNLAGKHEAPSLKDYLDSLTEVGSNHDKNPG